MRHPFRLFAFFRKFLLSTDTCLCRPSIDSLRFVDASRGLVPGWTGAAPKGLKSLGSSKDALRDRSDTASLFRTGGWSLG